jgi:hypothetical protein
MSFGPSSPVTGGPQTGLTSPTYTFTADVAPNSYSEQYAVTTLGGTQTNVVTHSVSSPFTVTMERPAQFKQLGVPNPVTGIVTNIGRNVFVIRTRKGVTPLSGQAKQTQLIETRISVPAGADTADAVNVRAALSAHIGVLWAGSAGVGDSLIDGIL